VPVGIIGFFAVARLIEDPPWVQRDRAQLRDIDTIGLALIALGLGALQIMLDRGEDSDWFASPTIQLYALLAAVGIAGGVAWLLLVEKPVVDLRCLKDRNFGVGVVMVSGIGAILYSTSVIIPVMAQQWFGYTALLAGLLLSPGAAVMLLCIPITMRLVLPHVQTRYVVAFGFFALGCSAVIAHRLTPQMDFWTLASFRAFQTVGLAFLFVPNSTLSYSTLPRSLNADATALYSMFRNISGSVGIAVIICAAGELGSWKRSGAISVNCAANRSGIGTSSIQKPAGAIRTSFFARCTSNAECVPWLPMPDWNWILPSGRMMNRPSKPVDPPENALIATLDAQP